MSGLTDEQQELYSKLQNTIGSQGNIANTLQEVSKDDLFVVLATKGTTIEFKNGERKTGNLLEYAAFIKNQEGLKAILKAVREKGISFGEMVGAENTIKLKPSNIVKFDGTPPKEEKIMQILLKAFKESDNFGKFLVDNFNENKKDGKPFNFNEDKLEKCVANIGEDGFKTFKDALRKTEWNDALEKILRVEKSIAASKAMKIGGVCSVIAALTVGIGCFVGDAQLSILAIVGVAVAVALAVGFVAGGITYEASKPSDKLDELNLERVENTLTV
ncbi:MAG: hypothetical protein PG978_000989 [Wolbachia endosymbiont of Ctenocephalides felis wCfeF]|nr:MAG: hypothetical protein PG978_000989 [Wolbachia endosymbiont of Ctenocephalides felis wCfeF]